MYVRRTWSTNSIKLQLTQANGQRTRRAIGREIRRISQESVEPASALPRITHLNYRMVHVCSISPWAAFERLKLSLILIDVVTLRCNRHLLPPCNFALSASVASISYVIHVGGIKFLKARLGLKCCEDSWHIHKGIGKVHVTMWLTSTVSRNLKWQSCLLL